ncbi:MAG: lamin tail domain-containing protein [Candidatus Omnitrophota bacterium]
MRKTRGQATMIAVTILALLFIVGIAFFTLAQTERTASIRNLDVLRTHYIAEAGIAYAREVLKLDRQSNLIDGLTDRTFTHFAGNEADLDNDGEKESRWIQITDGNNEPFGRFSIRISDEASKININTCSEDLLEKLFSQLGIGSSGAGTLFSQRPFNAVEQIGSSLEKKDFALCKDFVTIYSKDQETDLERQRKVYLNTYAPLAMLQAFLRAGVAEAHQKCANLKDASDEDVAQTRFDRFVRAGMVPTQLTTSGSWVKKGNYYEAPAGSEAGKFSWSNLSLEEGEYFCYVYGPQTFDVVGVVYSDDENSAELLFSGESLSKKVKVASGTFTLNIKPAKEDVSRFSHVKLVSLSPKEGMSHEPITGTEALVINELMVKPWQELSSASVQLEPGQSVIQKFTGIKSGYYHVMVLAASAGGCVGDVTIHGNTAPRLYDKQYFPYTLNCPGELTVEIKNNGSTSTSFKGVQVSQQPDAEYIEIYNLCGQEISLSHFSIEVYSSNNEPVPGWPASIPEGVVIRPYQYLVLAVDSNDSQGPRALRNNNISFQGAWRSNSVSLVFDEHSETINKSYDLLPDTGATVILKDDSGRQVDAAEYTEHKVLDFVSLERGDPSEKKDSDGDGVFDGWYICQARDKATPALANENEGMYTRDAYNRLVKHSPGEITVFNRPLTDLSQARKLSTGISWAQFTAQDCIRMADKISLEAVFLGLAGHYVRGTFKETEGVFESSKKGESGIWEFSGIQAGLYLLSIVSENLKADGNQVFVSIKTDSDKEFKNEALLLFSQGTALFGTVECEKEGGTLQVKVINDSNKNLLLKSIILEPVAHIQGRININTAKEKVLRSVLDSEVLVQAVLQNRPLGTKDNLKLGVGALFLLNENFIPISNQLSVRSDVYGISCIGEYNPQGKTLAFQNIRTVVERGE